MTKECSRKFIDVVRGGCISRISSPTTSRLNIRSQHDVRGTVRQVSRISRRYVQHIVGLRPRTPVPVEFRSPASLFIAALGLLFFVVMTCGKGDPEYHMNVRIFFNRADIVQAIVSVVYTWARCSITWRPRRDWDGSGSLPLPGRGS